MITRKEIIDLLEKQSLVVEPLLDIDSQIGSFTISLRMGTKFLNIGKTTGINSTEIGNPVVLEPYTGILTASLETIKLTTYLAGLITLRSAFQNLGLMMNSSFIDPGYQGKITFNLFNISSQSIQLFAGQRIVLLALFELKEPTHYPIEKYTFQIGPSFSKLYESQEFVKLRNFISHKAEKITTKPKIDSDFKGVLRDLLIATDSQEKGRLLERFMRDAISTIKGLKILDFNARLLAEEIDIIVQNNVPEGFWRTIGSPIVVECKNWTKKVGSKEISILSDKMKSISSDVKLGLLVAPNGVSGNWKSNAILKIREKRQQGIYIVVLVKEDLEKIATGTHTSKIIEKKFEKLFLI